MGCSRADRRVSGARGHAHAMTEPRRVRLKVGGISAVTGALVGLVAAIVLSLDAVVGFAVLAATASGLAGAWLAPTIVERRSAAWLALSLATYVFGVLLFPLFAGIAHVDAPFVGTAGPRDQLSSLLPAYAFTPFGLIVAGPVAPFVLVAALVTVAVVRITIPAPIRPDPAVSVVADARFRNRVIVATVVLVCVVAIGGFALSRFTWGY